MDTRNVPVIAIDGPSASGKGTVAQRVAAKLGFHYLDSGALYRLVAWAAMRSGADLADESILGGMAARLDVIFRDGKIQLGEDDVTDAIRTESCGRVASRIAAYPEVRAMLLERQRAFCRSPGLVADGRDMGSVVFPCAVLKIFLTASVETRARRRHKQLMEKGIDANISTLLQDLRERDMRDSDRSVAPLRQGEDAHLLDTTTLDIEQAVNGVLECYARICETGRPGSNR